VLGRIFRLVRLDGNRQNALILGAGPLIDQETVAVETAPVPIVRAEEEGTVAAATEYSALNRSNSVAILGAQPGDRDSLHAALARLVCGDIVDQRSGQDRRNSSTVLSG
jgi:hypothetical protein